MYCISSRFSRFSVGPFCGLAPQMLHAASQASPRSVYVCGNTTSTTGLTVGISTFALCPSALWFESTTVHALQCCRHGNVNVTIYSYVLCSSGKGTLLSVHAFRFIHVQTFQQVTLSKEGTSGEVGLEAGALVLSDQVRLAICRLLVKRDFCDSFHVSNGAAAS